MAALTDPAIRKAKPGTGRRDLPDGTVSGLALRIGTDGTKTWSVRYRVAGRQRRLSLGTFPEVSLADARKAARKAINTASLTGADPAEVKKQRREAGTFGELCTLFQKATASKRSAAENSRVIKSELLPAWQHKKVAEVSRRDVRELLGKIEERGAGVMRNRVLALISRIFNWSLSEDLAQSNPATRLPKLKETSRDRVLTDDEIRQLWAALETCKRLKRVTDDTDDDDAKGPAIPPMIALGMQTLLFTAQRPGEVFSMKWADVDLEDGWQKDDGKPRTGWWTIPASLSKNGEAHRVFLSATVVRLLREAKAGERDNNPFAFAGEQGGSVAARAKKAMAQLKRAGAVKFDAHRHDLRRTAATLMGSAGISRATCAFVLNHVDRGSRMTQVYERFSHDPEKQIALETLERRITAILTAKGQDNVIAFARA